MKFCKDCQYFMVSSEGDHYAKCGMVKRKDMGTGKLLFGFCHVERVWGSCGEKGKNFMPKLCENCGERPPMEHTPYCEVCRDEMEDRYAENEKAIAQHE